MRELQKVFHIYKAGVYEGTLVATDAELAASPFTSGPPPNAAYKAEAMRKGTVLPLGEVLGNMVEAGWLSEAAAEKWLDRTALPAPLVAELASLPNPKKRLIARAALFAPSVWRLDPVWTKVFTRFNKEEAEIDAVFGIA